MNIITTGFFSKKLFPRAAIVLEVDRSFQIGRCTVDPYKKEYDSLISAKRQQQKKNLLFMNYLTPCCNEIFAVGFSKPCCCQMCTVESFLPLVYTSTQSRLRCLLGPRLVGCGHTIVLWEDMSYVRIYLTVFWLIVYIFILIPALTQIKISTPLDFNPVYS